jgi:2',3'-cyclic-nucleotide 2'-phosphodiesterase/3'-nucleotidase/5'-nucleotidase
MLPSVSVFRRVVQSAACVLAGLSAFAAPLVHAASPDVVISQVYGGGGNSGATYKNDFIELYNRGSTAVSLNGWSVQYASATGATWQVTNLSNVTLQPGQYYLVQEAVGTGGTANLPTPDATGTIAMSGTAGKVALVTSTTALTCGSACATNAAVRDFVGFGTTANNYEGSAPTPAPSNTTAVLRAANGATDTDNNGADFAAGAPNPRNTATTGGGGGTAVNGVCGASNGASLSSAPTTNLCSAGTASAVSGTGPWTWSCAGSGGGTTASCSANKSTASPFTIIHMNDVHARLTPHDWVINKHSNPPVPDVFEKVGGAAYLAGKVMSLAAAKPTALVLDGGDISEGNPVGDMNGTNTTGYGNGGMTGFYSLLHSRLQTVAGRGTRGIDALVVGNHDVRDASYIANMEAMAASGVPVISANVRDLNCTSAHVRYPTCEHFPPTTMVTVNGTKIGIIGYTTSSATVGASLSSTLTVVDCQWTGSTTCNIAPYVNTLRGQGADVVVFLTHDGHSDLVDNLTPVLADTADAKVPEIVVSGHWHTWAETVWQPMQLNYKTIFTEASSYMKYVGELNVSGTGQYLSATNHVLRNSDITPDPVVQAYVDGLIAQYNSIHPGHPVDEVVGYTNSNLMLDDRLKWWSANEYPWSGNNTAGQWITDAMKWKCDQITWPSGGGCDLGVEAGGGVRADIPAGPVTYKQVYETFPWADDTFVRITMTGQDIINFLKTTNMNAGFSRGLDVTAFDGIPTIVKINGAPIGLSTMYKLAINNYMWMHPPSGYVWPSYANPENIDTTTGLPTFNTELVRDGLMDFMRSQHPDAAHGYETGGERFHFNGAYAGGYRAVVTLMDDAETYQGKRAPKFDKAFIRFLNANSETLARRGGKEVPADLVNADGTINQSNRLAEQELYRSYLGFKTGSLKQGDIIEVWGKGAFYDGNPEFVDQEGVYGDGVEFKIVGHDATLAQPLMMASIGAFWNDQYKNHYVQFLGKKTGTDTVVDQYGQTIKIWDVTGYNTTALALPGNVGDVLLISGVPTMENYALRFRRDVVSVSSSALPAPVMVGSTATAPASSANAPVTITANISAAGPFYLSPVADAQVASGKPSTNYGTGTNAYVQSSSTSSFGNERVWVKFDLSTLPTGMTITGASLQLWDWKSAGAAMPAEVRGGLTDSWTETGLTWNSQPTLGNVLDTQTLAAGATDLYYGWNVGSFVQQEYAGDKLVSLVVKPVTENSTDATSPSYSFDTKEYGSNPPVLQVQAQGTAASVQMFYRYSADNTSWGAWTAYGVPLTTAPYNASFSFPQGNGYYQFYSRATDSQGNTETTATAQATVLYTAAAAQTISFGALAPVPAGSAVTLSATASSGLPVTFSSQTSAVCTVSGTVVTAATVGTCTVVASQAGNSSWLAAPAVTQSFEVTGVVQAINFPAIASHAIGSGSFAPSASATSGLAVTLSSQTPSVCSVTGDMVNLLAVGTCSLQATQGGDSIYAAATPVTQSFAVTSTVASSEPDGDAPIPEWALVALSVGLLGALRQRQNKHGSQ